MGSILQTAAGNQGSDATCVILNEGPKGSSAAVIEKGPAPDAVQSTGSPDENEKLNLRALEFVRKELDENEEEHNIEHEETENNDC